MLGWAKQNSWPTDDNIWLTLTRLKVWRKLWNIVKGLGMSGVSSHMLSPLASNKEPHVPTGCFLRMGALEAEYRNRLQVTAPFEVLLPFTRSRLGSGQWETRGYSCQRCKKKCLKRNKTGPRVLCWQSLWEQSLLLRRCCNMALLPKGQGRVLASCGKCSFTVLCLRHSTSSSIPVWVGNWASPYPIVPPTQRY